MTRQNGFFSCCNQKFGDVIFLKLEIDPFFHSCRTYLLKVGHSPAGGGKVRPFPPQLFLNINLMSWNFYMNFWGLMIKWLKVSNFLYRRCQPPSTHFRGHWKMVDFPNIVKITTIFQNFVLSREIRDLRTCNPGAKKFLNFLKNRFLSSESLFKLFMMHRGICDYSK